MQAALEEGAQLIVAAAVGDNAAGNGYRIEMLDQVKKNTGVKPRRVWAGAG